MGAYARLPEGSPGRFIVGAWIAGHHNQMARAARTLRASGGKGRRSCGGPGFRRQWSNSPQCQPGPQRRGSGLPQHRRWSPRPRLTTGNRHERLQRREILAGADRCRRGMRRMVAGGSSGSCRAGRLSAPDQARAAGPLLCLPRRSSSRRRCGWTRRRRSFGAAIAGRRSRPAKRPAVCSSRRSAPPGWTSGCRPRENRFRPNKSP